MIQEAFSELYLPNCKVASDSIVMGKTGEFQDTELAISTYDAKEDCIARGIGNFKA